MQETRTFHVERWAAFVREHSDAEWSKLQKELIDAQIENARNIGLSREQVDAIKAVK